MSMGDGLHAERLVPGGGVVVPSVDWIVDCVGVSVSRPFGGTVIVIFGRTTRFAPSIKTKKPTIGLCTYRHTSRLYTRTSWFGFCLGCRFMRRWRPTSRVACMLSPDAYAASSFVCGPLRHVLVLM